MIYRGYSIRAKEDGEFGVYRSGYLVISQASEDSCMAWIDSHKKALMHEADRKRAKGRDASA